MTAAPMMLLASTQRNRFHSPSPRSRSPLAPSCHGFQTTVVLDFAFWRRIRRRNFRIEQIDSVLGIYECIVGLRGDGHITELRLLLVCVGIVEKARPIQPQ